MANIPGNWQVCTSGQMIPARAVHAPDSYSSCVALWDFDHTIGRACVLEAGKGMDAWFPHGGLEHSAHHKRFQFRILLEDTSSPFLWVRALEVMDQQIYKPFMVQGYVPLVIMNVCGGMNLLGKGSLSLMQAWISYGGREQAFRGDIVTNAMVLCQRVVRQTPNAGVARRDVQIAQIPRITPNSVTTSTVGITERKFNNTSDQPMEVSVQVAFENREGQSWEFTAKEHSELKTVFDARTIIDALVKNDLSLGWALFGRNPQTIQRESTTLTKSFTVPPRTQRNVRLSIQCQEMTTRCQATEITYDRDGRVLLQRQVDGVWRGATSKLQICEFFDTPARAM